MSKVRFLFTIAILAVITFLIQTISGFILWLVLPHEGGYRGGRGVNSGDVDSTFIWARQTWLDIHDWAGVAFIVIIVLHVYMHWRWLYRQAKIMLGVE